MVSSRPRAHPEPYLRHPRPRAAPEGISGITSYLRARLAFHLYPQLIPSLCPGYGFGLPVRVSGPSPWPGVARSVSGLLKATMYALFGLGFPVAPGVHSLNHAVPRNSPDHSSISTPSSALRRTLTVCGLTVSGLFTPLSGCFPPFPHGTGSLSVAKGSSPWRVVPPASHGIPRAPWYSGSDLGWPETFAYGAFTPSGGPFQGPSADLRP